MKKPILFAMLALGLALGACDKTEETLLEPTIPLNQVKEQPATVDGAYSVPDLSSVVVNPDITKDPNDKVRYYLATYSNGQTLAYSIPQPENNEKAEDMKATITAITGTATEVVIPKTVVVDGISHDVALSTGDGIFLESVKKLTLPSTISVKEDGAFFYATLNRFLNLENIVLETGFKGFATINGAVYTEDLKEFVFCPVGRKGEFSIADGTEIVRSFAFAPDGTDWAPAYAQLTRIVVPASVKEIQDNAFLFNKDLMVINMLGTNAPVAKDLAFGYYARKSVLCIPAGAMGSYIVAEPTIAEPVPPRVLIVPEKPEKPGFGATDEEKAEYEEALKKYEADKAEYDKNLPDYQKAKEAYDQEKEKYDLARENYYNKKGYTFFPRLNEVTYQISK